MAARRQRRPGALATAELLGAGTAVHVDAGLYGLDFGDGAYGAGDVSLDFTIGRSQIVKAVAPSQRMQVVRDGVTVMDIPVSYGEGNENRNVTRSGIHVVSEMHEDFLMSNPPYYENVRERWAVRISNNGEFIHANPLTVGVQGASNVTNGCINLSLSDAQEYFGTAMYGDPVEVSGTRIDLSAADGDIYDWAIDWPTWTSMPRWCESRGGTAESRLRRTELTRPPCVGVSEDFHTRRSAMRMRRIRTLTAMCVLALAAVLSVGVSPAAANPMPTIVLVHGAFADTTSWDPVAAELRGRGHDVVVSSNPLRGPATTRPPSRRPSPTSRVRCCWSGTRTAVSSSPTPTPPTWSAWSTLPPSRTTRVSPRRRRSTRSRSR